MLHMGPGKRHGQLPKAAAACLPLALAVTLWAASGCATPPAGNQTTQPAAFVRPLPAGEQYTRLLAPPESVGMRSGLMVLAPGKDCGWHSTEHYEELLICLEGTGELETEGGGRRPIAAGYYAYNPPRTRHCVFNTGSVPLRYIYVVAPAKPAQEQHKHSH